MKKYRVLVSETVIYAVNVEADSEEEAEKNAMEIVVDAEDVNDYFSHIEERSIYHIAEEK